MMRILDSCAVHIYIRLPETVNNIFQNSYLEQDSSYNSSLRRKWKL